jgi:hypothetical protein
MASVWIARQTGKHGFQRLVAIKTILPKFAAEPRFQRMFVDEARIASRIEHVHVTQILDVGEQHGITYLVMEYIDGDALSKLSRAAHKKGTPIPAGVALRVMADVCGGLHAAHELQGPDGAPLGVVHRDVSPQNVLVSTKGVAKLIDFGIAKARDRLGGDTNVDQLKGKVQYMAPEQALGHPVDRRTDVWAVGAVLYHLLGGKPPYDAENDVATLFMLSSGRPPPPLRSDVHGAVVAVVRRALSHTPHARFATAAQMQHALEEAIVQASLSTTAPGVAAYLAAQMGDRAVKRKEAIALGLKAAEDREKYAEIMLANTDRKVRGEASDTGVPTKLLTPAYTTSPSSTTGQTLGSAAVAIPHREGTRGLRFAVVGGVVGAAIGALGLVSLLGRGHDRSSASAPAPHPPVASVVVSSAPATSTIWARAIPDQLSSDAPPTSAGPSAATTAPPAVTAARPLRTAVPSATTAPTSTSTARIRVNDGF